MRHWQIALAAIAALTVAQAQAADKPHNLILFVPDGMRTKMVTPETAPTMAAIRDQGVNFRNSHSMFPTFTMPNASAMATGHWLGDTGVFSNNIYAGYNVAAGNAGVTPSLENDAVQGSLDRHEGGNFLDETSLLSAARRAGLSTAAIGKVGPILIFDHIDRAGAPTIVVDDATGSANGIPLAPEISDALKQASLPLAAPSRGANGDTGTMSKPGTTIANVTQQNYFVAVATKVVLPMFKARNQQGQGMHGSFSRGETLNFMAATGPDFKTGFVDPAPVSNADIGKTLAHVLGLTITAKGKLQGRVIAEAMPGGATPKVSSGTLRGPAEADGLATVLLYQEAQGTWYFDAAGFPSRTLGLDLPKATASR